ncbi:transcriptional adapter 2-alpha [Halyomorpha halys]|uniref:transcriptional adapter 2-alpha n=1 Tax=Halyomorpha halys TaxID=286706 RepID=UPI0006D510FE|nr:transcriptional adapter 2-alpha [Halyomorpha halys]
MDMFPNQTTMSGNQSDVVWNEEDELKLLNAISNCGLGNWQDIASLVQPYTPIQCEKHYFEKFVRDFDGLREPPLCPNNCKVELEDTGPDISSSIHVWTMNNMLASMKWKDKLKEPRPITCEFPHVKNLTCSVPCTGYSNIRSDFVVEYNNNAESILKLISMNQQEDLSADEDSDLISEMEHALLQSYNSCLEERNYRKCIVRNHGLVDRRKTYTMLQRLEVPFGRQTLKALVPILRFLNGPEFDFLVERLKYQNEIRINLSLFIEYRKNGLIYLDTIDIYKKLRNKRLQYHAELQFERSVCRFDDKAPQRKPTQPLALENLPGYNLLSENEKFLCSTSRIVPETYNTFKELLINECKKHGGLKLAQARTLIKIDVNKTRKIYDHLLSLKLIWHPAYDNMKKET